MLSLIMRRGPTPGMVFALEADEITIGRGIKNGIVIHDNEVSRTHCRLVRLMGDYEVRDLNSINGTFVNGQRVVTPWLLQQGALIELGDTITLEYGAFATHPQSKPNALPRIVEENPTHFCLMMTQGPIIGSLYPLRGKRINIGRDLNNEIMIDDSEVSRVHARLHFGGEGFRIEDLASTNGTFINDTPLRGTRALQQGDVIRLGTMVQFEYMFRDEPFEDMEGETPINPAAGMKVPEPTLTNMYTYDAKRTTVTSRSTGLAEGALENHLLIVYAREDWDVVVAPLLARLQDTRLNAWIDQYLQPGTEPWRAAVDQALKECWLMVLVVSPDALKSNAVKMMYRYFLTENKPVIPLVYGGTPLPPELSRLRSIAYDANNSARVFHKLIFEIRQAHQTG